MILSLLLATLTIPLPHGFQAQAIAATKDFVAVCGANQLVIITENKAVSQPIGCGANPSQVVANGKDLVVANHDTDYITVLHNEGSNHFTSQTLHVHSKPHPHTVAAADLNRDGRVDLITDSWGENRLTILYDGKPPGTTIDVGRKPYINVVASDIDGDGNMDLVVPNQGYDTVTVLYGPNFQPQRYVAGPTPFHIAVADVNGDGRPDILVANYSGHITDIANDGLTWLRNDGQRRFTASRDRIVGRGVWRVAAGDLNGDGIADAAFVNGADDIVTIVYGSKSGLRQGPSIHVMPHPHNLAIANGRLYVITEEQDEVVVVEARK